jgi:hypothetical protein
LINLTMSWPSILVLDWRCVTEILLASFIVEILLSIFLVGITLYLKCATGSVFMDYYPLLFLHFNIMWFPYLVELKCRFLKRSLSFFVMLLSHLQILMPFHTCLCTV